MVTIAGSAELVKGSVADIAALKPSRKAVPARKAVPDGIEPDKVDRRAPPPAKRFLTYSLQDASDNGTKATGDILVAAPIGWLQVSDPGS